MAILIKLRQLLGAAGKRLCGLKEATIDLYRHTGKSLYTQWQKIGKQKWLEKIITAEIYRVKDKALLKKLSLQAFEDLVFGAQEVEHVEFWAQRIKHAARHCPTGWNIMAELMVSNRRPKEALEASQVALSKWEAMPESFKAPFKERTVNARFHALMLNQKSKEAADFARKHGMVELLKSIWTEGFPSLPAHAPAQFEMSV